MYTKLVSLQKVFAFCNENKGLSSVVVFFVITNMLALFSPIFEPPCVSCSLTSSLSNYGGCPSNAVPFTSLKAGSPRTQRSPKTQRMAESSARDIFGSSPPAPPNIEPSLSSNPSSLSGVDGDIKEAFGDRSAGRNLRDDLLLAADSVTSAMSSLVKELNSEDEDDMEVSSRFANGKTNDTDLDVLEQQVNQIRQSLESHDERTNTSFANGDVTMTEPSQKIISHGPSRGGRGPRGRRVGSEGDTDTDDDDSHREVRRGDYKSSSRTQMTDDESYIQTDDDTIRTDDEDMEWQEAIKRWVNR